MILTDSVHINAPPERVWQYLEDPERMKLWNPKIKDVVPIFWGQRSKGFRYRITYVMGAREREFSAEIEEYQPCARLVIRHTGGSLPVTAYVQEMYELSSIGAGTLLTQTIRVHNLRVNFFLRLLVSFVIRFGKPTGKKYLEQLRELAEGPA